MRKAQHVGEFGLGLRREPPDESDLHPEVGEQLGLFQPDIAAAEHDQRRGQALLLHRGA